MPSGLTKAMYINAVPLPEEELTTGGKLFCGSRLSTCLTWVRVLVSAASELVLSFIWRVMVEEPWLLVEVM